MSEGKKNRLWKCPRKEEEDDTNLEKRSRVWTEMEELRVPRHRNQVKDSLR